MERTCLCDDAQAAKACRERESLESILMTTCRTILKTGMFTEGQLSKALLACADWWAPTPSADWLETADEERFEYLDDAQEGDI